MFKKGWGYSSTGSPRLTVGCSTNLYLYWLLLGHDVLSYAVLQLTYSNIQLITGTLPYLTSITSHFPSACLPYV